MAELSNAPLYICSVGFGGREGRAPVTIRTFGGQITIGAEKIYFPKPTEVKLYALDASAPKKLKKLVSIVCSFASLMLGDYVLELVVESEGTIYVGWDAEVMKDPRLFIVED